MALTLLQRWLAHYDPAGRGWSAMGIAAGAHAVGGLGWIGGARTLLFRGATRATIDRTHPVGVAPSSESSIAVRADIELADGTHYFQAIPYGPGGVAAVVNASRPQIVAVVIDGGVVDPKPEPVRQLRATPEAGGEVTVGWTFLHSAGRVVPDEFAVFTDAGGGTIDYETPVAVVARRLSASGEGEYAWRSEAFADGLAVKWAVRSRITDGADDGSTTEVTCTADASAPTAGAVTAATLGEDE